MGKRPVVEVPVVGSPFQKCHCIWRYGSPLVQAGTQHALSRNIMHDSYGCHFFQDPVPGLALAYASEFLEPLSSFVKWPCSPAQVRGRS